MTTEWNIDEREYPANGTSSSRLQFVLRYAALAPSSRNSQPWRFIQSGRGLVLLADRSRAMSVIDPFDRELTISCAAALFNLRVAMAHFGLQAMVELFPSQAGPDVLATVEMTRKGPREEALLPLFHAITERSTNRTPFSPEPASAELLVQLAEIAAKEKAEILTLDQPPPREEIGTLVREANVALLADPRYRREMAAWSHPQRAYDGVPLSPLGLPRVVDFAEPNAGIDTTAVAVADEIVHHELERLRSAPLLCCILTPKDTPIDWMRAGQALQRLLLTARLHGFDASFFNQVVQVAGTRAAVARLFGGTGSAQLLLRLGKGVPVSHTARRPIHEVMR